jgi:hypothetical protein
MTSKTQLAAIFVAVLCCGAAEGVLWKHRFNCTTTPGTSPAECTCQAADPLAFKELTNVTLKCDSENGNDALADDAYDHARRTFKYVFQERDSKLAARCEEERWVCHDTAPPPVHAFTCDAKNDTDKCVCNPVEGANAFSNRREWLLYNCVHTAKNQHFDGYDTIPFEFIPADKGKCHEKQFDCSEAPQFPLYDYECGRSDEYPGICECTPPLNGPKAFGEYTNLDIICRPKDKSLGVAPVEVYGSVLLTYPLRKNDINGTKTCNEAQWTCQEKEPAGEKDCLKNF